MTKWKNENENRQTEDTKENINYDIINSWPKPMKASMKAKAIGIG